MTLYQRAMLIWAILIVAAHDRRTYTYGQLAALFHFGGAGVMGHFLAPVFRYCQQQGYPPLTLLVVRQTIGRPGDGLTGLLDDLDAERERVYQFDWLNTIPPDATTFEQAMDDAE